jgi:membrane-bound ClpP family serine protease
MGLSAIVGLILLGLLLLVLEFLVLPGTNVAGILGIVLIIAAIYYGYKSLGVPAGHFVLVGSLVAMIFTTVLILRSKTWRKISLDTSIDSKVEDLGIKNIKIGDTGKAVSRLAPIGMVEINNTVVEGKSGHKFIDPDTFVEVINISRNQVIVKPIEKT